MHSVYKKRFVTLGVPYDFQVIAVLLVCFSIFPFSYLSKNLLDTKHFKHAVYAF